MAQLGVVLITVVVFALHLLVNAQAAVLSYDDVRVVIHILAAAVAENLIQVLVFLKGTAVSGNDRSVADAVLVFYGPGNLIRASQKCGAPQGIRLAIGIDMG